jgi:flavodoxin
MKSIVIYYSYSGNTRKLAMVLNDYLAQKGESQLLELHALDEARSFLGQCRRAVTHTKAKLAPVNFDFSGYDLICFGTPVWAFAPAPAMNSCLDKCTGLDNKRILLFSTYGSGTGNERCLRFMQELLAKKGAADFKQLSLQQSKVKDKGFVLTQIIKLSLVAQPLHARAG